MGDVIRATRAILDQLDPLSEEERSRVIGTLLTLHGAQQPGREVAVTTAAPEPCTAPSSPAADPKAGGAPLPAPSVSLSEWPCGAVPDYRQAILDLLRGGPMTAIDLMDKLRIKPTKPDLPTTTYAWRASIERLQHAGLVALERRGRHAFWRLSPAPPSASAAGTAPAAGG